MNITLNYNSDVEHARRAAWGAASYLAPSIRTQRRLNVVLRYSGYYLLVRSTNTGESIDQHIQNNP